MIKKLTHNAFMRAQRGITGLETAIVLIAFVIVASVFAFAALSTGMFTSEQAKGTVLSSLAQAQGTLVLRGAVIAETSPILAELVIADPGTTGTLLVLPVVRASEILTHSVTGVMTKVDTPTTASEYSIDYTTGDITLGAAAGVGNDVTVTEYHPEIVDILTFRVANAAGGNDVDLTPGFTIIRYTDSIQTVLRDAVGDYTLVANIGNADGDNILEPGEVMEMVVPGLRAALTPDLGVATRFQVEILPPEGALVSINRVTPGSLSKINDLG